MGTEKDLTFTVDKMYILPDAGSLKGFCDLKINDCMTIRGIRILGGKKGLFLSMPQEQGKDNRWYDQIVVGVELHKRITDGILKEYDKRIEETKAK